MSYYRPTRTRNSYPYSDVLRHAVTKSFSNTNRSPLVSIRFRCPCTCPLRVRTPRLREYTITSFPVLRSFVRASTGNAPEEFVRSRKGGGEIKEHAYITPTAVDSTCDRESQSLAAAV
jgi:hypothetical protein